MGRDLQDKVKKAESDSRKIKKSRNPDQAEQAAKKLALCTSELRNLKNVTQNIIGGEEARNVRAMQVQWSNLLKSQATLFGQCVAGAAACADELNDEGKGKGKGAANAILTETVFKRGNGPADKNDAISRRQSRRGSLDSNIGDSRVLEEKSSSNTLGRPLPKLADAMGPIRAFSADAVVRPVTPRSSPARSTSNGASTAPPLVKVDAPQLSLPSFSPLDHGPSLSTSFDPAAIISAAANSATNTTTSTPSAPKQPPKPIIKSTNSSATITTLASDTAPKEKRRVAFPTSQPIASVRQSYIDPPLPTANNLPTLSSYYPDIFAAENTQIASVPVVPYQTVSRNPAVYVAGGDGDAESQIGSVVGGTESLVGIAQNKDFVYAIHDFSARSGKEMSLKKGDVIEVRKRQGTWIYGTKIPRKSGNSSESDSGKKEEEKPKGFADRFLRGVPQSDGSSNNAQKEEKPEVGWIPMAFVAKFSAM